MTRFISMFLLLGGCVSSAQPAQGTTRTAAADDPNCASMAQSFDALCANPNVRQAPPEAATAMKTTLDKQRSFIVSFCPSVAVPERVAKMDACIATVGQVAQSTAAEADARRSAAAPKVAEVRADPEYQAAAAKVRALLDEQRLHCENAANAERDQSPNLELWRKKCRDAEDRTATANGQRLAIVQRHGIDPRDADALGLKP
jgi:hypothetical protein